MDLTKFFESLANGARWDVGVSINRSNALPLDANSVFSSLEAAQAYVNGTAEGVLANAYPGQVLAVVTEEETVIYYVDANKALQPVGNTKDVMAYIGSIPEDSDAETIIEYINAKTAGIASDAALKELQGDVESLEGRADALESVVGKAAEGEAEATGLVKAVADNTAAIAAEVSAREQAISDEASARATAISAAVSTLEGKIATAKEEAIAKIPTVVSELTNDADYQSGTQVSAAISTAIAGKADASSVYTKGEVDTKITGLENTIAGITHFTTKVVSSTTEVTEIGVLYLIKDESVSGTDKYNEYLFIEGLGAVLIGDTTTDLSDYVTNDALATELAKYTTTEGLATVLAPYAKTIDVETELAKKVNVSDYNTDKATFALEESVASRLAGKAAVGDSYLKSEADALLAAKADKETVNAALASKIETAQITHTTTGTTEGVTKEGTALKIVVDSYTKAEVYTKSETDNQIDAKIASVTGGESAADVKLALESYRDAVNTEIWGADAASWTTKTTVDGKTVVTYTPQYGSTSRVDTLESDVATLKTNVQAAQKTADDAATAVSTLESGKVAQNASKIAAIEGAINNEGGLSSRITSLEGDNTTNKSDIATLKTGVSTNTSNLATLTGRVDGHDTAISTINGTLESQATLIGTKANSADVYTKGEVDGFVSTINTEIGKKADAATTYSKTEVDTAISTAISNIDNTAITNNSADIAVLVGSDKGEDGRANKSIRAIAADEINTLIKAADPEGGKTIENINNLIAYVDENAGEIAELITATDANTAKLAGIDTTVVAAIQAAKEEAIVAIPALEVATAEKLGGVKSSSGDNKVSVAADGVMSVATVNVNTLTQTAGDILILNGGSAAV